MESEGKVLQAIFDNAALGIAQISLDGSWLRVNARYCEMLGYSESELLTTRKVWDITRPPDYDEVSRGRRQLLEGAISSHTMEKRFVRKDGTIFWGRLNRSLVRDQDNQPQYFIAVVEDITEKTNTERALRDSEQRLTLAQGAAHLGVCQWDLIANVLTYSEEYARLYGLSPDDPPLTLEDLAKRTHPDDRERVQTSIRNALEQTHDWDTEYRVLWPDGSVHWLHSKGAVFVDAAGRPVRSTGVVLDITDHKRALEALYESEERFRVTFYQAAVGMAQARPNGQWLFVNDKYCDMLGYSQTELLGKNFLDLTHPDDRENSRTARRQLLAGEISSLLKEKRYIRKDGETLWARLFISLVRDQHNQPQYFISVLEDITEQKLMQERLQASEARLMEAQRLAKVGSWEREIKSGKIHWSDEIFRILGLTSVPENFAAFLSYVHPKDRETILGIDDIVRSSIAPVEVEYRIIRPDGETRFVRSIVKGIRDDHGVLVRITGATQDITERKRLERIAEANRKEVQALAASLMTAQEDERRRVSLELHDGMCQELGSLAIEIGKIAAHLPSPQDVPGQLRALQARVVKASVEARNLAYQLSPPGLDELGLPIVLQDLCNQFAERAPGMALEFTSGALPESVPLKVTSCVYRVAQESLYNTVKHSRAKHASVILTWRQGAIELTIADDGDGFDSQSVQGKGGLGLIGMEERARLVHGKLTIMSHPGSGTRIALDVPLPVPAVLVTDNDR